MDLLASQRISADTGLGCQAAGKGLQADKASDAYRQIYATFCECRNIYCAKGKHV